MLFRSVAGSSPAWVVAHRCANGILAQLGEHLPYKQRVIGSSPIGPIRTTGTRPCGGTGRRAGLKILLWKHSTGSIPVTGIQNFVNTVQTVFTKFFVLHVFWMLCCLQRHFCFLSKRVDSLHKGIKIRSHLLTIP